MNLNTPFWKRGILRIIVNPLIVIIVIDISTIPEVKILSVILACDILSERYLH